jgi:hypothetical protein
MPIIYRDGSTTMPGEMALLAVFSSNGGQLRLAASPSSSSKGVRVVQHGVYSRFDEIALRATKTAKPIK